MLEFDFRNGHLRRKYDGLKYALKNIEEILFELSLVNHIHDESSTSNAMSIDNDADTVESVNKRSKVEENGLISVEEITKIKERFDLFDKERENVIKLSRDLQKLSKQAIYSIHRGNLIEATQKLDAAKNLATQITPTITQVSYF